MDTKQECNVLFSINLESNISENSGYTATYLPSHKSAKKDDQNMPFTAGEEK